MAKLGDVFPLVRNGASIRQTDGASGIPITRIETISNREIDRNKFGYADITDSSKYKDYILQDGDILMSHINSEKHLGKVALYRKQGNEQIIHGMNLLMLRANPLDVFPPYATHFFETPTFLMQIQKITKKSVNQASFTVTALKEIKIPLPSLDEQRRIAAVLDKVSGLIAKRREQLDKLDELVKARFVEMFGDPLLDSGKYPKVPLGSLAEVGSSKRIFEKEYVSEGVPFYRTKEIVELSKGNRITTELFITRERYDEIRREYGVPQTGDLLISAVGTIGVIWIVDGKNDFYFKDGNLLRVATSEKFVPIYLKYLLESLIGAYKLEMSSGTAYAALTISALKEILVYEVPLAEQEQFATFVKQIDKSKLTIQQSLDKLEVLKKALMQQYLG